jgi:hypothetical protein
MASGSIFSTKVDTSQRIMSIDFYDEDMNIKVTFPAGRSLDFEEKTDHGGFDPEIDRDYFFCFNLNYRHPYQLRQILMEHVERLFSMDKKNPLIPVSRENWFSTIDKLLNQVFPNNQKQAYFDPNKPMEIFIPA